MVFVAVVVVVVVVVVVGGREVNEKIFYKLQTSLNCKKVFKLALLTEVCTSKYLQISWGWCSSMIIF